jgi:tripartite-type tricarboxylate transporter receptor subunit TctC
MKRLAVLLIGIFLATAAKAQDYPAKPVRFVVGFGAGGPTDIIARIVAQDLTVAMGQPFLVENRPGANAIIATEYVARSTPDGYTMLFSSLSLLVNAILPGSKVNYDPFRDFAPVSDAAALPQVVVASPQTPFNSIGELVALAKQKPGELSYATSGHAGSTHLAGAMLENATGTKMINVPFKGNGPALTEVMAGRVTFMFYPAVGIADLVAQKRLKVLAVATAKPWADFAGVPTMEQLGLHGFEATAPWVGLLAPAGTPPAIVEKVSAEMRKSLAKPETQARMKQLGAIIVADSPAEFAAFLRKDHERWAQVIRTAGIRAE